MRLVSMAVEGGIATPSFTEPLRGEGEGCLQPESVDAVTKQLRQSRLMADTLRAVDPHGHNFKLHLDPQSGRTTIVSAHGHAAAP